MLPTRERPAHARPAVVLPTLRHRALVKDPAETRVQFERVTRARIMLHEVTP